MAQTRALRLIQQIPNSIQCGKADRAFKPIKLNNITHSTIRRDINRAECGREVVSAIECALNSRRSIGHISIYYKAMQKCELLRDWESIPEIMDLLLSQSHLPMDTVSLNKFLKTMIDSDSPEECAKYFDVMVDEHGVTPNMETFIALIKSFRMRGKHGLVDKYWCLMQRKFRLLPRKDLYTEMLNIYSNAHRKDKAALIFKEYLQRVERKELRAQRNTFSAYLRVFCKCGDIQGMQNVIDIAMRNGMDCNEHLVFVTDMISGYYNARMYEKCIEVYDEWVARGRAPGFKLLHVRCTALARMIGAEDSGLSLTEKYKIYHALTRAIYTEFEQHGFGVTPVVTKSHLIAVIYLYVAMRL